MSKIPFLIIGGGIGGLATALAVAAGGRPAHVIEQAEEFTEIGAGLQVAPNATRMLDRLGVWESIRKNAIFPQALVMMDAVTGKQISAADLGPKFQKHFGYPYIVMHRGDLLKAELDACRNNSLIRLENNKKVTRIEDLGTSARVECADGTVYEAEAVVGADGLWSTARKHIGDNSDPICAQYVAYRGTLPMDDLPEGADTNNMTLWVGPDVHFVQYPIRSGELLNQVAVFRSYKFQEGHEYLDDWGNVDELDEHFGKMCDRVRAGISKVKRNRRWPMFDRLPLANWTRNRVTLLGDAAHPMLQYIAQGACQALEDAICLGDLLQKCDGDVKRTFAAYQAARIPRTAQVQRAARYFGELKHLHGVGRDVRNALLGKRAPDDYEYFEWLYGYKGC